ncbi:hypothetical protein TRVL_09849 [Trypanosoma vivax]|nr:hypothetical protein TRVL_09849 [Trypanosoma vivax]
MRNEEQGVQSGRRSFTALLLFRETKQDVVHSIWHSAHMWHVCGNFDVSCRMCQPKHRGTVAGDAQCSHGRWDAERAAEKIVFRSNRRAINTASSEWESERCNFCLLYFLTVKEVERRDDMDCAAIWTE